jgi:S1-C subfamily serine protease
MKRLALLTLFFAVNTTFVSPRALLPQVEEKLLPCTVRLRQEVIVETIKNPVIENDTLTGGEVAKRAVDILDMGSGTIISKSGLILTNFHVWQFETRLQYDKPNNVMVRIKAATNDMLVYMLDASNVFKEPKKRYVAELLSADEDQDIVVLRCSLDANTGQEIARTDFSFMKLGNPFGIPMNAKIDIVGYPGIGGKTVTMTEGKFLGYVADDDCTVKTDAPISFGNSGGSAVYQNTLFGIPTAVSARAGGASFGYIVPVTRALGPLVEAGLRYGEELPSIDKKWVTSNLNSDLSRDNLFVGGKIISAQTNAGVEDARVWVYRSDRTAEQVNALYKEVRKIRMIVRIQRSIRAGHSVEDIAKEMELAADDVRAVAKIDVEENASADAKAFFDGEFFYTFCDTGKDGFFFTRDRPVPRNRLLTLVVVKDGFRRVEKPLNTTDDLYQDLGAIKSYPY